MSGVINTGSFSKDLLPGVNAWFGAAYNEIPPQYLEVFKKESSDMAFEEDVAMSGLGLIKQKNEAEAISFDHAKQLYTSRYLHTAYASGLIISREMIDDGRTLKIAQKQAELLGRATAQTKNVIGANILNRAFDSNFTGGDGTELCATDHATSAGDLRNELSTASDLSESTLEQAMIDIRDIRDDRGLRAMLNPKKLIVPPEEIFNAERLVSSTLRPGTADNDVNAHRSLSMLPEGVQVYDYLTDADAWFITTDSPDGLKMFDRVSPELKSHEDGDTLNMKFALYTRFSFGWSDPRGIFGSPGA